MAPLSRLVGGLAVGLAALLALAAAAPALLDADALRVQAQEKVRKALHRDLQISGLDLRLLPSPTIRMDHVALSNPDWASQAQLLQAEDVSARMEWLPLLRGRLVLTGIAARKLQLNLETDDKGRNSWDLPPSDEPPLEWKRLRHADIAAVHLWRRHGRQAASEWQLQKFTTRGEPGWKQLDITTDILAHGETLHAKLKLDDAARLGTPGASSQGEASFEIRGARLQLSGQLPLSSALENYAMKAQLKAESLAAWQRFTGEQGRIPSAPIALNVDLKREKETHLFEQLRIKLGKQEFEGSARLLAGPERWRVKGELKGARLDWAQTMLDLGHAPPPQKPQGELLPVRPFAWPMLAALQTVDADIDTRFATLVMRGGLELKQWHSQLQLSRSAVILNDTRFKVLGGKGTGRLHMAPQKKEMHLQLQLQHLMLQEWFDRDPKRPDMVGQGPMDLKTDLRGRGNSWKELAANASGPLSIAVGAMTVRSKKAREAEAMLVNLVPAFSDDKAEDVQVACLASELRFSNGRAQSRQAVGVRSQSSKLLLGGSVDLRQQSVDLGGRVRAADGVTLGIATLAGDVRIAGPLLKPQVSVEPVGALARVGAALATAGLSVLATAAYDAATAGEDPCALVAHGEPDQPKPAARAPARTADTR